MKLELGFNCSLLLKDFIGKFLIYYLFTHKDKLTNDNTSYFFLKISIFDYENFIRFTTYYKIQFLSSFIIFIVINV